ncbi:MAG: primosomal protein N', partial [Gammaproteobacteria bacterium]|nr:primosomal protein N' [Gammaproteobacteria bacterium]
DWAADYYQHPLGEVLPLGLSPRERRGQPERALTETGIRLTARGQGLPDGAPHRAPKQAALVSRLKLGPLPVTKLKAEGFSSAVIKALKDHALVEGCELTTEAAWQTRSPPLPANAEQQTAIDQIVAAAGAFSVHLLYGVTGSGKTEVYLQSVADCLNRGRQALVLLPEIALTPQTLARFEARFEAPVIALHSGMGDAERDRAWVSARRGRAAVILGTRSSVFVPLLSPGLIIVDEEHDAAYVQQDGFRYSARDVAIKRAQLEQCPVVLGSATPSLESWHNAELGRFQRHSLTQRAGAGTLPTLRQIDISGLELSAGLSPELLHKIEAALGRRHQVLVFLNRRGFANALLCHDCGWSSDCADCDARMTLHKTPPGLHCHHCGRRSALPRQCPRCQSRRLVGTGVGTQQTETFLAERFADFPVIRVDSDTMTSRQAMPDLIEQLAGGDPVLMIGTQMLSKGHHFPHVTLVAVVDADALLFSPDFRGEERLLQLLTQVGGRAGRDGTPSEVLIQTRHPDHPLMQHLDQPYHTALPALLNHRIQAGLPPHGALGVIRCDSQDRQEGLGFLSQIRNSIAAPRSAQIIGPLSAAMARRKNRYRSQLVISAGSRSMLAKVMTDLITAAEAARHSHRLSWSVDIDPYESL